MTTRFLVYDDDMTKFDIIRIEGEIEDEDNLEEQDNYIQLTDENLKSLLKALKRERMIK